MSGQVAGVDFSNSRSTTWRMMPVGSLAGASRLGSNGRSGARVWRRPGDPWNAAGVPAT